MEPEHEMSAANPDPAWQPVGDAVARVAVRHDGKGGMILVRPNRSLTRTGLLVATGACLSALLPATLLCALLGAWPVLPFLGLEIVAAVSAFAWLARHHDDHERVVLDAEQVRHLRIDGRRRELHNFPRYWVRLVVEPGDGERRTTRLWLRSHGHSSELGRDSSAPTRTALARSLERDFGIATSHAGAP